MPVDFQLGRGGWRENIHKRKKFNDYGFFCQGVYQEFLIMENQRIFAVLPDIGAGVREDPPYFFQNLYNLLLLKILSLY